MYTSLIHSYVYFFRLQGTGEPLQSDQWDTVICLSCQKRICGTCSRNTRLRGSDSRQQRPSGWKNTKLILVQTTNQKVSSTGRDRPGIGEAVINYKYSMIKCDVFLGLIRTGLVGRRCKSTPGIVESQIKVEEEMWMQSSEALLRPVATFNNNINNRSSFSPTASPSFR